MSFPVDILDSCSHEDLEKSGEDYLTDLRCLSRSCTETLSLPNHGNVSIRLETVGFVPLYGEEEKHKVLGLFIPRNSLTAVALYLADRWWPIDDILRTSVTTRQGLQKVKSVGERIVLYVLNRIIYRTREMERNEIPFLCHGSNDYAKIMWEKGEAIGFYSVKPKGTNCSPYRHQSYKLSVIDTMFVRKKHRETHFGLIMLEDFVDSFKEATLGLRYPLSSFMHTACKQYLEKYPEDNNLLWEVEGAGSWFQRTSIMSALQKGKLKIAGAPQRENEGSQVEGHLHQSVALSEASEQETELKNKSNADSQNGEESVDVHASMSRDPNIAPASIETRSSYLKRARTGKTSQESEPGTSAGDSEEALHVSESRLEPPAHTPVSTEELVEVPEKSTVDEVEIRVAENEGQAESEANQHVPPSEKQSEEVTPPEPLNGEVTEGTGRPSHTGEEEIANQVQSGESELQAENQDLVTLFVPIIVEPQAKPSENTVSEEVLNASASEMPAEETTEVEQGTVEQQEPETTASESAAALASKEEPSGNGLPNSMVTEAAEESVSENVSPKTASSLEDQNEEAGHNSQEAPVALSQSSLIVVELEGFSFQQPSGQEEQKNQLESSHLEPAEQMDQRMQTVAERAADSSSEEAEIEVPVVDRRNLRRKAKSCKGPPKKKGKPS